MTLQEECKARVEFAKYKWMKVDYDVAYRHMEKNGKKYTIEMWFSTSSFWAYVFEGVHIPDGEGLDDDDVLKSWLSLSSIDQGIDKVNEWWKEENVV